MQKQQRAIGYALLSVILWSTVAVSFKKGLEYFHYIHFLTITITVAVITLFTALQLSGKLVLLKKITKKQFVLSVFMGLLNPFLYYLMLFKAYSILPAQIAQSLNYTWPIILVLLSAPLLNQKLKLLNLICLFIGLVGVYFIASQGRLFAFNYAEPFGIFIAISSSLVWALYWVFNTRQKTDPLINLFLNFVSAWIIILPISFSIPFHHVPKIGWFAAIYSGFFEMGFTFIIWLNALRLTQRTDQVSSLIFLSPFLSLFFICFLLHEQIYFTTIVGLILIIISVFIPRLKNTFQRKSPVGNRAANQGVKKRCNETSSGIEVI